MVNRKANIAKSNEYKQGYQDAMAGRRNNQHEVGTVAHTQYAAGHRAACYDDEVARETKAYANWRD